MTSSMPAGSLQTRVDVGEFIARRNGTDFAWLSNVQDDDMKKCIHAIVNSLRFVSHSTIIYLRLERLLNN